MDGLFWFIGKKRNNKIFYLVDYDDDNNTFLWSLNRDDAVSFRSERTVNRFIKKQLNERTDVILIHAPLE